MNNGHIYDNFGGFGNGNITHKSLKSKKEYSTSPYPFIWHKSLSKRIGLANKKLKSTS